MGDLSASPASPPTPPPPAPIFDKFDNSNLIIQRQLRDFATQLEDKIGADCLTFIGPITYGVEDFIRESIENRTPKREKLAVVLETGGGYIEVAQRIADILRHHYKQVDFIIPNFAMSAGTVLVMCGDSIWMDYFSVIEALEGCMAKVGETRNCSAASLKPESRTPPFDKLRAPRACRGANPESRNERGRAERAKSREEIPPVERHRTPLSAETGRLFSGPRKDGADSIFD